VNWISELVAEKMGDLSQRPEIDTWAACAAVWGRTLMLATPGWARWPEWLPRIQAALTEATNLCLASSRPEALERARVDLGDFDIEDDGSSEWQYVIDLTSMLLIVLEGRTPTECVKQTLTWCLEGTFNVLSNDLAEAQERGVSHPEARRLMAENDVWLRTVAFVRAL
jgi:hypothetical protein